jgi:hypothetical protein
VTDINTNASKDTVDATNQSYRITFSLAMQSITPADISTNATMQLLLRKVDPTAPTDFLHRKYLHVSAISFLP